MKNIYRNPIYIMTKEPGAQNHFDLDAQKYITRTGTGKIPMSTHHTAILLVSVNLYIIR